jgi:phosphatidylglycerophosphate synthase
MFDERLREVKERIFVEAARLGFAGWHPHALTLAALLLGAATAVALAFQFYLPAFVLWWLNRIFDGLDGTVARMGRRQSDLGGYLDILSDFVVYALVPLGLVAGRPSLPAALSAAVLLATFYLNAASWIYLSAILEKRRREAPTGQFTTVAMPAGLIGGFETMICYALFILLPQWMTWLFAAMSALVLVTIMQRLIWAIRRLK